jgi:predicted tellurium resistance membrane protein TerC
MPEILDILLALGTLTILEVILGIDNLVFLSILSQKLPRHQQAQARRIGLAIAWITRLIFLASALWIAKLVAPLFTIFNLEVSWRDLFLFAGGVFLLWKATQEIHHQLEQHKKQTAHSKTKVQLFWWVILQIVLLDVVFSLDSILTAIGLSDNFWVMAIAITIAILAMIFASEPLSSFIERHPSVRMLALSFLLLIALVLIADAFHSHIPRGYVYFAMGFSLTVECLNLWRNKRTQRVRRA